MIIIGAGYSGLLAGCIFKDSAIIEKGSYSECRDKHQAVFRMKTDRIAKYLGIEFKKVKVCKGIWKGSACQSISPDLVFEYSKKVSGMITDRSISNIRSEIRYIPPNDFWNILIDRSNNVSFDTEISDLNCINKDIISTIPLFSINKLAGVSYPSIEFNRKAIFVNKFRIKNCDAYATIYYPDLNWPVYRATLNGDILIVESLSKLGGMDMLTILKSFGLSIRDIDKTVFIDFKQPLGKITEIDNKIRSDIILNLTLKHNIYSLGRYATWRPKVMLDDVFDDIFVIRRLIENGKYASMLHKQEK